MASRPSDLISINCTGDENHVSKSTYSALCPLARAVLIISIIALVPFIFESARLLPANDRLSVSFSGPRLFFSFMDEKIHPLTGKKSIFFCQYIFLNSILVFIASYRLFPNVTFNFSSFFSFSICQITIFLIDLLSNIIFNVSISVTSNECP